MSVSIVTDLQFGDASKTKIAKVLSESKKYLAIGRYGGGANCGRTVHIGNKKYVTHYLTAGIYQLDCCLIYGPSCYIHPESFLQEVEQFEPEFKIKNRIYIDPNCSIVTDEHIKEDNWQQEGTFSNKLGTTGKGIKNVARDKYARVGKLAKDELLLKEYVGLPIKYMKKWVDFFSLGDILLESHQGMELDIESEHYPYVTSSHIHPAHAATSFGFPVSMLGKIYGVAKPYVTYSGGDENHLIPFNNKKIEELIVEIGEEKGNTTGRARHIGVLNLDQLINQVKATGAHTLVFNKIDVMEKLLREYNVDSFHWWYQGTYNNFSSGYAINNNVKVVAESFIDRVKNILFKQTDVFQIYFSREKDGSDLTHIFGKNR